jgi:hypothetical protein
MKIKKIGLVTLAVLAGLFVGNLSSFAIDPLPLQVGGYEIDTNIWNEANKLPTMEQRYAYLAMVVKNMPVSYSTNNFKVASAIRLLEVIHSTNSIPVLASRIDFMDYKYNNYPAMPALAALGEAAVPQLLEMVRKPKRPTWVRNTVEVLMNIKGEKYIAFVNEQKNSMPPEAWKRLSWYAFHSEVPPTVSVYPLPQQVCGCEVETNVYNEANKLLDAEQLRVFLESVVINTTDATGENNSKIASAIRLLGVIRSTNSITMLASKIDFLDTKYHNKPAVFAMAAMGETAVPQLMEIVKEPKNSKRIANAVQVLMEIKGSKYGEFLEEQKKVLPSEIWKRMLGYAVNYE